MQIQMTPEQFGQAVERVKQSLGVDVPTPAGTLSHSGVKASYDFNGTTLTINVLSKPFFVKEGYVEDQIHAWFAGQ